MSFGFVGFTTNDMLWVGRVCYQGFTSKSGFQASMQLLVPGRRVRHAPGFLSQHVVGGRAAHARGFFFAFQLLDSVWTRFSLFRGLQIFSAFPGIWTLGIFVVSAAGRFSVSRSAFARFCCFALLRFSVTFSENGARAVRSDYSDVCVVLLAAGSSCPHVEGVGGWGLGGY